MSCLDANKVVRLITIDVDMYFSRKEWDRYWSGRSDYDTLLAALSAFLSKHYFKLRSREKDFQFGNHYDRITYLRPENILCPATSCAITFKFYPADRTSKIWYSQAMRIDDEVDVYTYPEGLNVIANRIISKYFTT